MAHTYRFLTLGFKLKSVEVFFTCFVGITCKTNENEGYYTAYSESKVHGILI